jgi:hypothetical protein
MFESFENRLITYIMQNKDSSNSPVFKSAKAIITLSVIFYINDTAFLLELQHSILYVVGTSMDPSVLITS